MITAVNGAAKVGIAAMALIVAAAIALGIRQFTASSEPKNPCADLADAECQELQSKLRAEFDRKFVVWVEEFNKENIDLRALPRAYSLAFYLPPLPGLPVSLGQADVVVVGTAEAVYFTPTDAHVTVAVEQSLKGVTAGTITVLQSAGPTPFPSWDEPTLGYSENEPLLLPGDRALLFLEYDASAEAYRVQSFTGHYLINPDGKLSALEGNPFGASVNGQTVDQFAATMAALLAQPPALP
jgi:hypothetical protein